MIHINLQFYPGYSAMIKFAHEPTNQLNVIAIDHVLVICEESIFGGLIQFLRWHILSLVIFALHLHSRQLSGVVL